MKRMVCVFSAVAALVCAIPALADGVSQPLAVKVGGFFPFSAGYRSTSGSTFTAVGVDYAFKQAPDNPNDTLGVYFDYDQSSEHSSSSFYGGGLQVRSIMPRRGRTEAQSPYVGFGAGYYHLQFKDNFANASQDRSHGTEDFGAKIFAGIGLSQNLFVEGNYTYLRSNGGGDPSGFGAQLGFRF